MERGEEIRQNRIKKKETLENSGFPAYPESTKRTHMIRECLSSFDDLMEEETEVVLTGRVRSLREHGKLTFFTIEDGTGKIQAFLSESNIGKEGYKFFLQSFDMGDFVEIRGPLFHTKRGERTLRVADYKMLTKSILPLPEKWHGLQSMEERYRKRYLDLIFNEKQKEAFIKRSEIIKKLRSFLEKKDFLEVETPVLQPIYGGTAATPFKTHHNTLDMELYLRIAPELYLKRLLVGGFERVFEFARCFRNEGIDRSHNPEFTLLEFYWAYADYKDMMRFTEEMLSSVIEEVFGSLEIDYGEQKISFSTPFERIEFSEVIKKETGLNIEEMNKEALKDEAENRGLEIALGAGKAEICDEIFKKECREKLVQPTFLIHHPEGFQPLAKHKSGDDTKLSTFQLYIAGWEVVNAFSELNDPFLQRERFKEQEKMKEEGFEEAQRMDEDFLEALEYGMPPAAGFGMGIDRLCAILTNSYSLREIILFPTMRKRAKGERNIELKGKGENEEKENDS